MSSLSKRQKEIAMLVLAVLLLIGSAAYSYFSLYVPTRDARLQSEQLLTSENEVLMSLQAQQEAAPPAEKISTRELQHKVTIEPLTDLILLQVEQAELLSETLVTSVNFAEAPLTLLQPVEGMENVQEVITTVEFNATDYKSIITFIKEIEAMERIMVVGGIDFTSTPEVTKAEQEGEPLTVSVGFSAFYRPDLIELAETQLKVDSPAPAKKVNPLPQNDGTSLVIPDKTTDEEVETQISSDGSQNEVNVEVNVEEQEKASDQ
ncbi:pilus assembly protein PilO [Planococcus sp. APC 3900]|uniref:pilus assembly protein PilO n=1 Tax=Planococcus sp. APC 3900 TaxID=3035191 RepID=UPI0025B2E678|nr:pilus assembly protein PilO [Planococcus sp. APC 3900]MDN3438191.1 pilus assembly protein PilO [Planococcus sp. APC 3900]